ncbi:hypothetical protein Runsl_2251 [Runella slithyformis DSM 19594]|uniref:Uncharacterized protein n=1 Tax=Runella slithyformis (strain ATCC 29530 / DSM 19594 / LMG 11500 / NCIMB 11436 / LSU 4) TaxID=761193 RepID=A0A7U4E5N7_RUNSL|nr:hypothetical protein Runsl_2251 [Runella slithyformis DSM 19594]
MTDSPKTEFYADRAVDQIEDFTPLIYKVIWRVWPTGFLLVFFGLWLLPENTLQIMQDTENFLRTERLFTLEKASCFSNP